MRMVACCLALVAMLTLELAQAATGKAGAEPATELVKQLGSRKYAQREAAARQLEALGEPALSALRRAVSIGDLEVRRRAEALLVRIEQRAEAARLLAGKRIRLIYKDTPLFQAVEDLAARTGFDVRLDPDGAGLIDKRLTLDTGETTPWEALRRFCQQAELSELSMTEPPDDDASDGAIRLTGQRTASLPTQLVGAVRVRALPLGNVRGPQGALGFQLEGVPEPGMPWQGVAGVRITRAIDDRGQELKPPAPPLGDLPLLPKQSVVWDALSGRPAAGPADPRAVPVWLARDLAAKAPDGAQAARLREVQGRLIVRIPVARQLLAVDDVGKAVGKTFNGMHGQSLTVLEVARTPESVKLRVQIKGWGSSGMGFQVARTRKGTLVLRGAQSGPPIHFTLQDASGAVLRPQVSRQKFMPNRGASGLAIEFQVTFALKPGQTLNQRLVCSGPLTTLLEVPFTLRDVPLAPANPKGLANGKAPQ